MKVGIKKMTNFWGEILSASSHKVQINSYNPYINSTIRNIPKLNCSLIQIFLNRFINYRIFSMICFYVFLTRFIYLFFKLILKIYCIIFFRLLTIQDAFFEDVITGLIHDFQLQAPMLGGGYVHSRRRS